MQYQRDFVLAIVEASIKAGIATADASKVYGEHIATDDIAKLVKRFRLPLEQLPRTQFVIEHRAIVLPENSRMAVREMASWFPAAMLKT